MSDPVIKSDVQDGASPRDTIRATADAISDQVGPAAAMLKDQASQAAQDAKSTVVALAGEARSRLGEIVDQQKTVGADHVAGVARAAFAAAGDLEQTSPHLARFVKSAAESVDHVAEDIRGSDISGVIATLTDFGRRQPVAFFGGAVVVGFLLARFLKSDAPTKSTERSSDLRSA